MNGKDNIRFSELFADTVNAHGIVWAAQYYRKHGMSYSEFCLWRYICKV